MNSTTLIKKKNNNRNCAELQKESILDEHLDVSTVELKLIVMLALAVKICILVSFI